MRSADRMTDAKDTHTHDPVARLELGGVVLVGPPRGTLFLCESGRLFSVLFRYIYNSHTSELFLHVRCNGRN